MMNDKLRAVSGGQRARDRLEVYVVQRMNRTAYWPAAKRLRPNDDASRLLSRDSLSWLSALRPTIFFFCGPQLSTDTGSRS